MKQPSEATRILGLRLLRFSTADDAAGLVPAAFGSTPRANLGARQRAEHDAAGCVRLANELSKSPITGAFLLYVPLFLYKCESCSQC